MSAGHINRAAEGFIFLRRANRVDASKFLIRPAIEAMIRLEAVKRHPELLFRIAYTERNKDHTWRERAAKRMGTSYDVAAEEQQWNDAKKKLAIQFKPLRKIVTYRARARKGWGANITFSPPLKARPVRLIDFSLLHMRRCREVLEMLREARNAQNDL